MLNQLSRILLLSMFFSITISNFTLESDQKTNKIYSIGTGISLNYKDSDLGFIVDSYHLFHSQSRSFDHILVKLGFGFNYNDNPIIDQMTANFSFTTSIGYLYIQNQFHRLSYLNKFGVGFTVDYTMISTTSHGLGVTIYTSLNSLLLGFGGGAVIPSNGELQPYIMGSMGFIY